MVTSENPRGIDGPLRPRDPWGDHDLRLPVAAGHTASHRVTAMNIQKPFLVTIALLFRLANPATASGISLVSTTNAGVQGDQVSGTPAISANGRFIAFVSTATTFDPSVTLPLENVYLKDTSTGALELISASAVTGTQASGRSAYPGVSANGRFVCFSSSAGNLVPGDTNGKTDVFLRDRQTGTTALVSLQPNGAQIAGDSLMPSMSADARILAFETGGHLAVGDTNVVADVYALDRLTGQVTLVSSDATGAATGGYCPAVSADGRYVVYVGPGSNSFSQVYRRDLQGAVPQLMSATPLGGPGNGPSGGVNGSAGGRPAVSANGAFVAFTSFASDLILSDPARQDVFLRDVQGAITVRASTGLGGAQPDGDSGHSNTHDAGVSLSADGRYLSYWSAASNLVSSDTNGRPDAFVYDRDQGTNQILSSGVSGQQADAYSGGTAISADGRFVAFESAATNLVSQDTNLKTDVFLSDRLATDALGYCVSQVNSLGCTPQVTWSGTPRGDGSGSFVVTASSMRSNQSGMLIYTTAGSTFSPFSAGYLCVSAPIRRTTIQNTGGTPVGAQNCSGHLVFDFNAFVASGADPALTVGRTVWAQFYSRDVGAQGNINLTGSVMFTLQ